MLGHLHPEREEEENQEKEEKQGKTEEKEEKEAVAAAHKKKEHHSPALAMCQWLYLGPSLFFTLPVPVVWIHPAPTAPRWELPLLGTSRLQEPQDSPEFRMRLLPHFSAGSWDENQKKALLFVPLNKQDSVKFRSFVPAWPQGSLSSLIRGYRSK